MEAANAAPQALRLCQMVGFASASSIICMHYSKTPTNICRFTAAARNVSIAIVNEELWQAVVWIIRCMPLAIYLGHPGAVATDWSATVLCNFNWEQCWLDHDSTSEPSFQHFVCWSELQLRKSMCSWVLCYFDHATHAQTVKIINDARVCHDTTQSLSTLLQLCCSLK